jgi:heparin/heparan-sulfate lyase
MPAILMACIGMADEVDGAHRFLENQLWRLDQHLPAYKRFLDKDSFQQSYSYTSTYMRELPLLFQLLGKGLGEEMFQKNRWFANCVKWWTYAFRGPKDGTFHRFGDYFCSFPALENLQYFTPLAAIAKHYKDPLAAWWLTMFNMKKAEPEQLLFEERPGVAPRSPEQLGLPRTRLFEAMGVAAARGDFTGAGTAAAFKCTPVYLHNHGHRDANSFVIYHKGDLAIDSGAYDSYETPQWYNYYVRTIAHNTIVVHDPNEVFNSRGKVYANDGGQRFINEPHFQPRTLEEVDLPVFKDGQITAYRDGEGYSYVCGDASNCYRPSKLKKFLRHVVFVLDWPRKACVSMVVLDEIELAKAEFEPRFLLHTMAEPAVSGNTIIAKHGEGRLTASVLLPESSRMETIGGPGREFWVDGQNYPLKREMVGPHTPGWGRVEVSGGSGAKRTFLTFLAANDASAPVEAPASAQKVDGGYVVKQGGLTVVLTRGGKKVDASGERIIRVELA